MKKKKIPQMVKLPNKNVEVMKVSTTFSPNHYPCDLYLRATLRYENLCSLPLNHTPVFTNKSKTHQRSTLNKRDQLYTLEINSRHKRSTLHT